MPEKNKPRKIKVITIGDEDTGKSCLIKRFCEKRFVSKYLPTIGIDYGVFRTKVGNKDLRVDIFDMSGNPAFYDIRNEFYKDTNGAILIFDVTKRTSFENLMGWIHELHSELKEVALSFPPVVILCANKALFESIINPEIYQSYMPCHNNFYKSPQYNTYNEMNFMPQCKTTMNTSKIDQSYNIKSKLKTTTKQSDISSSSASSCSRFNKNESLKFTYQDLFEINRIKNAKNNYERLGVNITASSEEIRKAFRRLAFILHPDKNNAPGSEEAFKILVKAKDALLSLSDGSNWFGSRFSS
ncbi:hypothetical protein MN116_008720 [Schistosoma mekongi]|uniref:J domain-containing protein n=1 Tax=Schistosoma mekongi TaxID=38744 RepID=A0AAE1Z6L5_SCHME|nr:hypothetical protein MN116_008720 [Schistosoma mekongi]